jgi:cytochrome c-type biogenesis protein CcmE
MRNRKLLVGGIIVGLAIAALAYMGFQAGSGYYFTVAEALDRQPEIGQASLRIQGEVAPGYETNETGQNMTFTLLHIVNEEDTAEPPDRGIEVKYNGIIPNNFEAGRHVVVEGHFEPEGSFSASKVVTACASKYEPA